MPELPEVETLRRQLNQTLIGQTITSVQVLKTKSFQGDPASLAGYRITDTRRFGKALVIDLTQKSTRLSLVIHLKMTGQLVYESHEYKAKNTSQKQKIQIKNKKIEPDEKWEEHLHKHRLVGGHPTKDFISQLPSSHTRVIFFLAERREKQSKSSTKRASHPSPPFESTSLHSRENTNSTKKNGHSGAQRSGAIETLNNKLSKDGVLYFNDQRIFGWIKLVPTEEVEKLSFIKKLGPEPDQITFDQFNKLLQTSRKAVKLRLMDQDKIAGIGNIYANDALWLAKIHPETPSNSLTKSQAKNLLHSIRQVIEEGIKYGGATAADGGYIDLQGLGGHYQEHFKVYQREGEPCLRPECNGIIQKIKLGGRGTFYCPKCQK